MSSRKSPRGGKNRFTTRNGNSFKINRSFGDKFKIRRDAKSRRKAERLSGMPKGRVQRFFWRMHPKRLKEYWFSRDSGIMALKVLGIGIIASFLFLVGLFAYFRKDLPDLRNISGDNIGGSIRYYDRTGKTLLWEDYDAVKRIPVEDEQISQYMKDATVALEDKDFFKHGGFDPRGITRAAWNNAFGGSTQGGSTITQQLVKLTQNWSQERTVTRKVKEVILAVELERSYSKKEILAGYLNTAPYGGIEYGVEAAARDYFEKPAEDLTLDEAAFLAAIPKAPRYYSPYSTDFDREAFVGRQHYTLDLMEQQGMITAEQRDKAKKVDTIKKVKPRKPKYDGILAPWFVLTAKEQLEQEILSGNTSSVGGWKVTTTLDMKLQKIAEEQIQNGIQQVRNQGGDTAAIASEDVETGQMMALVGGVDFGNKEFGQNNYARLRLPPGSSFKPYDYAALIENTDNFGAGSVLYDTQGPLEGYPCTNKARPKDGGNCLYDYDFRYPGPLSLRYSLGGSRNVPAVKAMLIAGVDKTIETANKLGLKSGYKCYRANLEDVNAAATEDEDQCYASSAIGDGAYLKLDEHVHAQASLSRLGKRVDQTYILKIQDAEEKPLWEWEKKEGEQVVRPDTAYIINDILSDPRASYMSRKDHEYNGWNFAIKTGTTNDAKDGWMTGYSSKYATSVWVGYHTRRIEMSGFMETMTQPIWGGYMRAAHDGLEPKAWQKPSGVKSLPAYVVRSHVGVASIEPSPSTDLFPSWYSNDKKKSTDKKTIDIVSNKLATECTPARAKKTVTEAAADSFSGDPFEGTGGANTSEKDDVHKCSDSKPNINVSVSGNKITVSYSQGTHPLSSDKFKGTVSVYVGSQEVKTFEVSSGGSKSFTYTGSATGTVKATIVDSVLYDSSRSGGSISKSSNSGSGEIKNFQVSGVAGNSASLTWSSYSGASSYSITWKQGGTSGSCGSTSGTSKSCSSLPSGKVDFTITSNNGGSATTSEDI